MTTFSNLLQRSFLDVPDKVSIVLQFAGQPDQEITYRQLILGANQYALTYAREEIKPGEVILLILQHGQDLAFSFWGAVLHGAIPAIMPFLSEKLSPERYRADLASLISITKPTAIITSAEFEAEARSALVPGDSVRKVIVTNAIEAKSEPDFDSLPGIKASADDIVLLQHSSGTTGLQKGVALSHKAVLNQLDAYSKAINLDPEKDVIVSWLPLYHDMGLISCFLMPVILRVSVIEMSPFDWVRAPYKLMRTVSQYKGTLSWLPNFAYNFCANKIRERDLESVDLSTWRAIINCSEPVHAESHKLFAEKFKRFGLRPQALHTSYAMAENVFGVTQSSLDRGPTVDEIDRESFMTNRVATPPVAGRPSMKMLSSGRPLENTKIRVVNENSDDIPDRMVGEIMLQSNCMLTGYYNRPDATETALRNGWYVTGDYGYLSNGELYVSGRKKDLIIVGGKNIYPQDLEALTSEVPGVHPGRTVAFGMYDEEAGTEEVVIIAEVDSEDPAGQEVIADAIRKHVTKSSAIALRHVRVVGDKWIVKTSSGKTARSANKEKFIRELNS
ncbi:MAG TPA: AMP-binding protein [Anaerolineales bacterium]|nr:AMP-binding protein [Anaerolineales bacterium]